MHDQAVNLEYKKYSVLTNNVQTTMRNLKKQIAPENYLSPDYRNKVERRQNTIESTRENMKENKRLNAKEMLEAIVLNKNIQTEQKKPL